ncbi:MAG TPA: putative porin [Verrucomicrobiae bacterium]|jgi:hypothetical protein
MHSRDIFAAVVVAVATLFVSCAGAAAQSTDALLNKLVEKRILTAQEAKELRQEAQAGLTKAYRAQGGTPDWVNRIQFGGDLRLRYDELHGGNSAFVPRNRLRFRLRPGFTAELQDSFEVGFRLFSGPDNGSPLNGNQTFEDNGSKKPVHIDRAYAKWTPLEDADWKLAFIGGKMENPFAFPDLIFDVDYTPEGFAQQLSYNINSRHTARLVLGQFVLDELSASSHDPFLFGAQLRLDSTWSERFKTSLGVAALTVTHPEVLTAANVLDINQGNTRDGPPSPAAALIYHYHPIIVDAAITYSVSNVPGYGGVPFPITIGGIYVHNSGAPTANQALAAGIGFGKSGNTGQWEVSYRYRYFGGDAWYEEVVDDDFGAFYQASSLRGSAGYHSGTNVRGHIVRVNYSFNNAFTFGLGYYTTHLIHALPAGSKSGAGHLLVDAVWKF